MFLVFLGKFVSILKEGYWLMLFFRTDFAGMDFLIEKTNFFVIDN